MIKIIKVAGDSLSPFFLPGDYVLIWRAPGRFKHLSAGDVVVFEHSHYGLLIKKVSQNDPANETIETEGTHPDSLAPRRIGSIPYGKIIGKVIRRIPN